MKTAFTPFAVLALLILGAGESLASEFFIKINRTGQHTVLVNDQYQTNNNNTYRFFDLPAGPATIRISDAGSGSMLFDGSIHLAADQRVVAELSPEGNVNIIATSTVTYTNWYTQNTQNTVPSTPVVTTPNNNTPPPPPPAPAIVSVAPEKFKEIVSAVKAQSVESYRLDKAKSIARKNMFSSKQVAELCSLFNVESYKLEFAKYAYDYTADKDNYFLVGKVFQVASYSRDLDKYIDSK